MKNSMLSIKKVILLSTIVISSSIYAGNEDRSGTAGATHLLINPWSRGASMGDAGIASSTGLEATYTNIAGLALTNKTQLKFNYSNWMGGAGIGLNSAGIAQRISEQDVFSISIQAMNFGDIDVTTVENPEGNIGTFSPRINVFNVGFARSFSSSIHAGINFKAISESMTNLKTTGIGFDVGIKYVTGEQEEVKFGIALKNVGPTMRYRGDGLNQQVNYNSTGEIATLSQRSQEFEIPALLNIGGSYDFNFDEKQKLIVAAGYTANSFSYDQFRLGLDYGVTTEKVAFNLRTGYVYEKNIMSSANRSNALVGPTAGFSIDALAGKNKNAIGIEYCARFAGVFGVIHTIGATISLK